MGEVWKADHHMLARSAAIKLIKQPSNETAQAWTELTHRFEREVQTAAQLRSPHTIEIYDYGVNDDGTCYYVMELLDGLDLEELVRTRGPLPWQRVVHLLLQVCHSLGEAHEHGLIHRDIKPANIFLCRIGRDVDRIKVLDFGLVKATMAQTDAGLTQQGMFVGTPAYAAPELATGEAGADHRIDVYSVGCVAFWLLTGQTVFQTGNALEMLMKHARDEPDAPSTRTELEVPPAIDAIVLACLSKEPAARPVSMDDLAARLQRFPADGGWTAQEAKRWWEQHRPRTETTIALASGG
jgi:serine/threonine-protein kinase